MNGFHHVSNHLLPFVLDPSIEIVASAIKALENIDVEYRLSILEYLRNNYSSLQNPILRKFSVFKNRILTAKSSKNLLGKILLRSKKITEEQLEISLLIQKRFPLLLGQIFRHLEYVSIPDIENSIASQKKFR
tara:strand:- start:756 stop:1154 length:399 start_codon:yes stop_codon:yes gene_type:complete